MGSAISLRSDFDGAKLRLLARQTPDADQARRLLALASIYDGSSRGDAARLDLVTKSLHQHDPQLTRSALGPKPTLQ